MSNTKAVEVSIQAAAPESIGGVSAAKRSVGIIEINRISNNRKAGRRTVFIRRFSRFSGINQFQGINLIENTSFIFPFNYH